MGIGFYVHIPFCLQQCPYCDFTTSADDTSLHQTYVENLVKEIRSRSKFIETKNIDSIYFGGGTPSLVSPELLKTLFLALKDQGFQINTLAERSIEINPGTIDQKKLDAFIDIGFNRFSLGAQTFDDGLLKKIGRKHNTKDTLESLRILNDSKVNYSFDLLFALPGQKLDMLKKDLDYIGDYLPPHISSYYLSIPEKHKLNKGRPEEGIQLEMFDLVENDLEQMGYEQYELSNFARNKQHSLHNHSAWLGGEYWGIGLSAHSHLKLSNNYYRFWNSNSEKKWLNELNHQSLLIDKNYEHLSELDRVNDCVHTRLRLKTGLKKSTMMKLSPSSWDQLIEQGSKLIDQNYLISEDARLILTKKGRRFLNYVLQELFLV